MSRDVVIFGRYWKATTFSSIVQPTIYLLAFGLGFGTLVKTIGHVKTIEYIATGTVATAVLFSSAFPGMFNTVLTNMPFLTCNKNLNLVTTASTK